MANYQGSVANEPQMGNRDVTSISAEQYAESNASVETYSLPVGRTFRFPKKEDMQIRKVQVRKGSDASFYLVNGGLVSEDGKNVTPSWFNLNSLTKRDADRVAVNPSWVDLDPATRLEALAKMGEIKAEKVIKVQMPVFTANGERQYATDENFVSHSVTRPRDVVVFTPYVG